MLVLPIKQKWFEMIAFGEKKEEYRELKKYYHIRFKNLFGLDYKDKVVEIVFRNGYQYNSPSIKCRCKLEVGEGKTEWGAIPNKKYYILTILEIIEIKNWNPRNTKGAMVAAAFPATPPLLIENDMQKEINKAIQKEINKQFSIGIDIEKQINRSGQALKNIMNYGG